MSTTSSRYSVENFDPLPDEELICSICRCVFEEPVECPCRHIFCRTCISSWLELKSSCPICRKRVHVFNLQEVVPLIKNMIAKLTMVCPNRSNGCKTKVNLENFNQHVTCCQHEQLLCKNKNCQQMFLRKDIEEHEKIKCEFRMVRCERDCNLMLPSSKVKQHDCIKELKKQVDEGSKREESLNKHIEELTNELNTLKKQATDDRDNPFNFNPSSPLFDYTDSSSSSSDSSISSFNGSQLIDRDAARTQSVIQSLHSRLFRMSSFMSSVDFLSRLDGTSRRSSNSNNVDESRASTDLSLPINDTFRMSNDTPDEFPQESRGSQTSFTDDDITNIDNNNSASQPHDISSAAARDRERVFRYLDMLNYNDSSGSPSTSRSLPDSMEADDEFPTAAQRRILKRKRPVSVISLSSGTEDSDSESRVRRRRSNNINATQSNTPNKSERRATSNRGTVIPRSIVPVEILESSSQSEDDSPSTVSRRIGLERTRELLELFSVETDPDWEPSTESLTSDGEVLLNIRSVPASDLLDSIIDGDSDEEIGFEYSITSSESENDDYEVLIPERTYDLLNRYTQDNSDDDEEWLPRSSRNSL